MTKILDLTGQRYGYLVATKITNKRSGSSYKWDCLCDCGKICCVASNNLRTGHTDNCGCVSRQRKIDSVKTHGMSGTDVYGIWAKIKDRCNNPNINNYDRYGALGIKMQKSWEDNFELFYQHIGPRPSVEYSVDRIDNTKGYVEGNVRWATASEQSKNKSMYKNNKTGLTGVHLSNKISKKGVDNWCYVCTWYRSDGTQANRNFSIKKYGLLPAMCMAYEVRKQEIERLKMEEGYSANHGEAKVVND